MNNKGFTLVELLAVIVILSLLVLLAGTSVTKIVKDSKKDISDIQEKSLKTAAKNLVAENINGLPNIGECSYLTVSDLKKFGYLDSETNENINDDLKIKITTTFNSKTSKLISNYEVNPSSIDGCYKHMYTNGEIVYFDVLEGKSCNTDENPYYDNNSITGYKGINPSLSNQNSCLKFYAFLDDGGSKINLLLDHNTTAGIAWNSSNSNLEGPNEVISALNDDTNSWIGTLTPSNYEYKSLISSYIIDYTGYKARLITAQEIAKITGADKVKNWNENSTISQNFYFYTLASDTSGRGENCKDKGCIYGWIYDRAFTTCRDYGCFNNAIFSGSLNADENNGNSGYWTSSACIKNNSQSGAWAVYASGGINRGQVDLIYTLRGVRPVIEVLKTKLK